MTHTPTDSGLVGEGDQEANLQPSNQQGDQPNLSDVDSFVDALLANQKFAEALGRQVQSQKDRRFSKIEKQQKGFAEQLAEFKELTTGSGAVSEAVALRLMALDRGYEDSDDDDAEYPEGPGKTRDVPKVDYTAVISSMDLDPNSEAVTSILRAGGDYASTIQALTVVANTKRAKAQAEQAKPASPAGFMPTGGGEAVSADLQAQYDAEVAKLQYGDIQGLSFVKAKYRAKGLEVW